MNPERWRQIRDVFEHAVGIESMERSAFLDTACATDPDLRQEVESLLQYEDRAGSRFLKTPAVDLLEAVPVPITSRIGRRVGAYQILEEIGHGGMGEVYRACRVDGQFEQEVAVKLVRGGYDSRLILERFRHERQILATLDHPNIARLLDGGTLEDGVPYLAMELIEGKPIDHYCEEHELSVSERLTLFLQVCAAVQYAHGHLVVHRDIKPGNILVTENGVPKLLDFGIAKILDSPTSSQTTIGHPLTPEYASPEQIRGEAITTASDVYSLGVVLYQLLTGTSPYGADQHSPTELVRAITEMEPQRPSTVVLRAKPPADGAGLHLVSEHSPAKLGRRLHGDLDTIVLKALRKEPQHRYASVERLSEDIRREMEGLPVMARKGSWSYRTVKFLRRNRIGMTAAVLVCVAVLAGVVATVREARIAGANQRRAERRFNDVRQLANSLIFEIHDSIQALPGATPSRKLLLDRAVEYLDKLSQDASGDLDLQRELAWGYERLATVQGDTTQSNLGHVSAAEESHRKATALFEAIAKANPHSVPDQLNLASAYRMAAFFDIYVPTGREKIDRALAVTDPLMRSDGDKLEVKNERAEE
jgi:serine/threonine protein kinase